MYKSNSLIKLKQDIYIPWNFTPINPNPNFLGIYHGYVRLSRDEDNVKKDSIANQISIIKDWATSNNVAIEGFFIDDNVTGYKFDRPAFIELKELLETNKSNGIISKDLSRIGRHNAHTLLFLEWVKEKEKRVVAINDSIDTKDESNDSLVGIKTWYNELYVKDISKKIRTAVHNKQKTEGLVIVPVFGYKKNPNENEEYKWIIDEEVEWIIKLIFELYLDGYGFRKIANYLNEKGIVTPALYKRQILNRKNANVLLNQEHLWSEVAVKRIIIQKAYMGTLVCGTTQRTMIKGGRKYTDPSEYHIHPNFFPSIIDENTFNMAQNTLMKRNGNGIRAGNQKIYKYAGILKCGDCEASFVKRTKGNKFGNPIMYVCSTYFRYGKGECLSHSILEEELDKVVLDYISELKENAIKNLEFVDNEIKEYSNKKRNYISIKDKLSRQLDDCQKVIKGYAKQLAMELISEDVFKELVQEAEADKVRLKEQLNDIEHIESISNKSKQGLLKSIDILREIIETGELTNKNISLLINKIIVSYSKDDPTKIDLNIEWEVPFSLHEITPSCGDVILWLKCFDSILAVVVESADTLV